MKTASRILVLILAGSLCLTAPNTRADVDVSVGVQINAVAEFDAPLAHHGAWIEVGTYGRCWRPASVAVGWRPYCDGHWEWTDCGWYWVSDEPWAWACYHYGSWYFDSSYGWVWVPGVEWAPAWVYWRHGGGHIGWAPCGPRGVVVAPSLFVFVGTSHFRERVRPSTVIVNNTTIINKTTQITEIKRETRNIGGRSQRVVVNEGPGVAEVQKATRKQFTATPVQEVDRRTAVPAEVKRRTAAPQGDDKSPAAREPKTRPGEKGSPKKVTPPADTPAPAPGKSPRTTEKPERPKEKAAPAPAPQPSQPEKKFRPPDKSPPDKVSPSPEKRPDSSDELTRPGRDKPSREDVGPRPSQPQPSQPSPPSQPPGSSKGKKGKGSDREKEKRKGPEKD